MNAAPAPAGLCLLPRSPQESLPPVGDMDGMRLLACALVLLLSTLVADAQPVPELPGALARKTTVQVIFRTSPDGATVSLLDMQKEVLGQSGRPLQVSFPAGRDRSLRFHFHLDGYEDHDLEISTADLRGGGPVQIPADRPLTLMPLSPLSPLALQVKRHPFAAIAIGLLVLAGIAWALPRQLRLLRRYGALRRLGIPRDGKDPQLGKVFAGWLLTRRLGAGGAGTVYEGVPFDTLDPAGAVAVKIVNDAIATAELRGRFTREVKIGMSLDHPAIVRLLDWSDADPFCIVMELVRGQPLSRRIQGPMPLAEARPLLEAVFGAVAHAHARGIVHNDLKPGNVMVTDEGQARVMDFGIATATALTRLTVSGEALGTPGYMAPEQYDGVRSEPASDQYALGCIVFEMLAGRPPFPDPDPMIRMAQHMKTPPPQLSSLRPDLPPGLSEAVDRMLAKKAGDRFPSVGEAWRAVGSLLS